MKTISPIPSRMFSRCNAAAILTSTVLSAVLLGGVSVKAATTSEWTATAAADFNVAADWTPAVVPTNLTTYVVDTNSFAIDISAGDTNIIGGLYIGTNYSGTVNMTGGTLNVSNSAGQFVFMLGGGVPATGSLGVGGPGVGTFNMSGGTLNVARDTGAFQQDSFIMADALGSTGIFNLSGGIANIWAGVEMGCYGASVLNVSGGSFIDTGWFHVGQGMNSGTANGSGTAAFNLSGGAVYILPNTSGETYGNGLNAGLADGQNVSNAVVNISGGTVYACSITLSDEGGPAPGSSTNTLNICGGNLYIGNFGVNSNSGAGLNPLDTINISGGTFHTVDMLVYGNPGAVLGSTNNIKADGTNWSWSASMPVNLTNSSFAVTNGINGNVTGPGSVTFAPEANRTITLNNNWSGPGAMVINGPGFVNMNEANGNTYAGGTTVNGTLIFGTAQPGALIGGITVSSGGVLALASAQTNAIFGVATLNGGSVLALNNNGALFESSASIPAGVTLALNTTGTTTFTNVVTGPGNVALISGGVVNVGSNLQNGGTITQSNGIFVVNGSILNASTLTNNSSATVGPLLAQGTIMATIGIGTNSSMEMGTTLQPATLMASNVVLNGMWIVKLNTATTVGGGVNDLLICSNLTLNPSSVLAIDPQSALSAGSYVIAEYSGTLTGAGFGTLTNGTGDTMSLSYATPGEVILTVGTVNQANLTWSTPQLGSAAQLWDVNTSTNWLNAGVISTFHQLDAVTFSAAPSPTLTNRVSVTGQIIPSSISISGGLAYLIAGTGFISGDTSITDTDTNTVAIFTGGNNYTGNVNINNGVFQLGSGGSSWLGTSNTTTVNGGTLDLNAQGVGAEPLLIQGTGSAFAGTNNGAINNSAATSPGQSAGPLNITLAGDTTLNASGSRWDIGLNAPGAGGGSFTGNSHNLVKIGRAAIWLHEVGDIGVGNIDIQQGELGFEFTIGMGILSDTVTVEPGATIGIFNLTNSVLNKQMTMNGNATIASGGNGGSPTSNSFIGPITLNGTNAIQTSTFPLNLGGNITGPGGYVYTGPGPLYLNGADTYSGPTVIGSVGSIVLNSSASIPDTSLIYLTPTTNTILNVSAPASFTLNSGQTLEGAGDIIGSVTASPGSVISLGTNQLSAAYGTIVFTNNLTLNGNTNYFKISDNNNIGVDNDLIYVNGTLSLSGVSTLIVTPLAALNSSQNYTIIQSGGIASGSTSNLRAISTNPRYTMAPVINAGLVQLSISGNAAPLLWKGNLSPNWDLVTSNWFNMTTASADHFYNSDFPTFDDSSTVTNVVLTNGLLASGINFSNVNNIYTLSGGFLNVNGQLGIQGNGSTAGSVILAMTNVPTIKSVDSQYGNLVYNLQGQTNYNVTTVFGDSISAGSGNIIFGGTNTANLLSDNYDKTLSINPFDGLIWITNGVLRYTNQVAFGANTFGPFTFTEIVVTNTGTLDFNNVPLTTTVPEIQGNGFNGQGALVDSVTDQNASGPVEYFTLLGNASVGATNGLRWDQNTPLDGEGQINCNGFKLTKVGLGTVFFVGQGDGDIHVSDLEVTAGRMGFQGGPIELGNAYLNNFLLVDSNAEVTLFSVSNSFDTVNFGLHKPIWLKGGASLDGAGSSNNLDGPIFLSGMNVIGTRSALTLWNSIMDSNGPSGFALGNDTVGASAANLYLYGTNSYSGPTLVSNETVVVGANSSLGLSSYVQVSSGASLDLSATPGYNFGATQTNQTMGGNGTVIGPASGNLTFDAGGTLAIGLLATNGLPDTNTFTLTMDNSVVFNSGSTNYVVVNKTSSTPGAVPADKVVGLTSLTLGGTLVITNFGQFNLAAGDSLALFSATTIATNSTFSVVPATPGPNLLWDFSSFLSAGILKVASSSSVNTNPTNITVQVSGGQLTLNWPADHTGWELGIQTNSVRVGISNNWVPNPASTTVDSIMIPINLTNGTVFYRLVYPPQ